MSPKTRMNCDDKTGSLSLRALTVGHRNSLRTVLRRKDHLGNTSEPISVGYDNVGVGVAEA